MEKIVLFSKESVDIDKIIDIELASDFGKYKRVIPAKWGVITILIYEEYYMRIESDLSVTIISDKRDSGTRVEVISAGGKKGMLAISAGAEKKAIMKVVDILKNEGFEVQED
ncbi:hypothetical protein EI71_01616 [Anaeroplasma bactoclasticum]|jgi:hypothetical protein|uniref:Uncharacterized protein n=1 Tax=Anaeroplasma bactoclasticum TaxID=2088 RepID=A0A397R947_9MOLU|nr:DUF6054 family protein [Anaeroplasma bactoclasticum]RIA66504.1 hypothetical protein EI71_01616 [Anaeroplasma bactoclasticum]